MIGKQDADSQGDEQAGIRHWIGDSPEGDHGICKQGHREKSGDHDRIDNPGGSENQGELRYGSGLKQ